MNIATERTLQRLVAGYHDVRMDGMSGPGHPRRRVGDGRRLQLAEALSFLGGGGGLLTQGVDFPA